MPAKQTAQRPDLAESLNIEGKAWVKVWVLRQCQRFSMGDSEFGRGGLTSLRKDRHGLFNPTPGLRQNQFPGWEARRALKSTYRLQPGRRRHLKQSDGVQVSQHLHKFAGQVGIKLATRLCLDFL